MKQLMELMGDLGAFEVIENGGTIDSERHGLINNDPARCFGQDNERCTVCYGIGWVVPSGSKPIICPNYRPEKDVARTEALVSSSGMNSFPGKTFEAFLIEKLNEQKLVRNYTIKETNSLVVARQAAMEYAQNPAGWLVMEGTYGCGKTHLAQAICNYVIRNHGMTVRFYTVADLLDSFRATFNSSNEGLEESIARSKSVQLLVLDDYGAEKSSEWADEKLFQLLNHRHSQDMPTVITTNMSVEDMNDRIRSRLMQGWRTKYVRITAPDYRAMTTPIREIKTDPMKRYKDKTFNTFNTDGFETKKNDVLKMAKQVGERWVDNYGEVPFLYLYGKYSTGKTHLAAAIANELYNRNKEIIFIRGRTLSDRLHRAINDKEPVEDVAQQYIDVPFLFLDDLYLREMSIWAQGRVFDILDERISSKLPTVITSTFSLGEQSDRLASRLSNKLLCYPFSFFISPYIGDDGV